MIINPIHAHTIPTVDRSRGLDYLEELSRWFFKSPSAWQEPRNEVMLQSWIIRNRLYQKTFQGGSSTLDPIHHWLRVGKTLWPSTDQHDWLRHMYYSATLLGHQPEGTPGIIQVVNLDGAANSGKTETLAQIPLVCLIVDPFYTRIFLGSGRKQGAERGVWARMCDLFREAAELGILVNTVDNGIDPKSAIKLRDSMVRQSASEIVVVKNLSEAGHCALFAFDKVANMKGKKPRSAGRRGALMVIVDESSYFDASPAANLDKALRNILLQDNAYVISAQNPEDPNDFGGQIAQPMGREYEELDIERDHHWLINYHGAIGYSFRYDAHYSPNVMAGKDLYRYLPKISRLETLRNQPGGEQAPGYRVEVRAWRALAEADKYVLNYAQTRAGMMFDEWTRFSGRSPVLYAFSDTSKGGDKWTLLIAEVLEARSEDGMESLGMIAQPVGPILECPILAEATIDEHWWARLNRLNPDFARLDGKKIGGPLPPEVQGAVWTAEMLAKYRIPTEHFGYDHSMRIDIMRAMDALIGRCHAWDYGSPAPESPTIPWMGDRTPREIYFNTNSFCHFLLADMIMRGRWRSNGHLDLALKQIYRRRIVPSAGKKRIESKDDYKDANSGRSPDEGDTLVGLNYVIWRNGGFGDVSQGSRKKDTGSVLAEILAKGPVTIEYRRAA